MAWFALTREERLGRCATQDCGGQPIWRFEGGGVGSNYCSGCKSKIAPNGEADELVQSINWK